MITPVCFSNIGYQTYIIFAVINACMVPSVYFFFPETAYRSLEEMDEIFHKTTGAFDLVKIAYEVPHRFDKNGDLLIGYEETEEGRIYAERRRSSVAAAEAQVGSVAVDRKDEGVEHREK